MDNKLIQATEQFVRERLQNETTGHDYWHANRVRNVAVKLAQNENADRLVVELAALLHDVGDRKVIHETENDSSIARGFLESQNVPTEVINQVIFIIDNQDFGKNIDTKTTENLPIEFQVVQDADRLDALGAIGIARVFATGQMFGQPLYDPDFHTRENLTRAEYIKGTGSSLAHFDEKLFKLKDLMNTVAARQMAESRDRFMHQFYERFLEEWQGEK
jgi:uncharacterized protein